MNRFFFLTLGAAVAVGFPAVGQAQSPETVPQQAGNEHAAATAQGPHGGTLRQVSGVQVETVVQAGGLKLFVYDRAGRSVSASQARGVASLQVRGGAKRYRYDLLPDGQGALAVAVDLSKIAGHQVEVAFQLVDLPTDGAGPLTFSEVAMVPPDPQQMAAAAIARQKVCPVSGKPLGSMGRPVAVDVTGQKVYVCCAGCVDAVKANPAKYASGRPEVTIAEATDADAPLIARQKTCPVMDEPLGSMGKPIKLLVGGKPIFLCCRGCIKKVQAEPEKYLALVYASGAEQAGDPAVAQTGQQVRPGVFKVTAAEQPFIKAQEICPVMDEPLDAMGGPYRVDANGKAIYICCPGCAKKIAAEPDKYLALLEQRGVSAPVLR